MFEGDKNEMRMKTVDCKIVINEIEVSHANDGTEVFRCRILIGIVH